MLMDSSCLDHSSISDAIFSASYSRGRPDFLFSRRFALLEAMHILNKFRFNLMYIQTKFIGQYKADFHNVSLCETTQIFMSFICQSHDLTVIKLESFFIKKCFKNFSVFLY